MTCKYCNKDGLEWHDFCGDRCDDCFDEMMEQEDRDFDIYYNQKQICFLCHCKLSGFIIRDNHAVCWPSCDNKLPPPVEITINDFL